MMEQKKDLQPQHREATEQPEQTDIEQFSPEYLKAREWFLDRVERHVGHKVDRTPPKPMTPEERAKMQELHEKIQSLSKEDLQAMRQKAREEYEEDYF